MAEPSPAERRIPDRLVPPPCEKCQQPTDAALRVERFVYFRCPRCGWITAVPKPRQPA